MSTTMIMTAPAPTRLTTPDDMAAQTCCPNCNAPLPLLLEAQLQISDLQSQVRLLNEKASAAVDRWADYEDELARLRSTLENSNNQQQQQRQSTSTTASSAPTTASPSRSSFLPQTAGGTVANRISALLSPRKPLPTAPHVIGIGSDASNEDLLLALSREQYLRKEAEGRLSETSREVEDLSVSLFEQANEMVATERRARAKLEERVKVLERREWEKKGRLERLEGALGRMESARLVLGEEVPVPREVTDEVQGEEGKGRREEGGKEAMERLGYGL